MARSSAYRKAWAPRGKFLVMSSTNQRWSRGHKARGQGHKKNPRPRTAFPRTDTLEAKDRNAQGQGPRTQSQVLSKKKKKVFTKIFQALHKILTFQKIVLSSSRGPANFRGLEASRPRPRTSKCVLEAKDVLEDSTSATNRIKRTGPSTEPWGTPRLMRKERLWEPPTWTLALRSERKERTQRTKQGGSLSERSL